MTQDSQDYEDATQKYPTWKENWRQSGGMGMVRTKTCSRPYLPYCTVFLGFFFFLVLFLFFFFNSNYELSNTTKIGAVTDYEAKMQILK